MRVTKIRTVAPALVAVGGLALTACSSEGSTTDEPTAATSPTPSSTVDVPASVTLTEPGSKLSFGDTASVIHEPDQKRGTVLELTVDEASKGTVRDFSSFILDDAAKTAAYYYVDVRVENLGEGDVGGDAVPLYAVHDNKLFPQVTFTTSFPKCDSEPLPEKFAAGDTFETCMVFQVPDRGAMESVSFAPAQTSPISWTGEVTTPKPEPKKTKRPAKKKRKSRG